MPLGAREDLDHLARLVGVRRREDDAHQLGSGPGGTDSAVALGGEELVDPRRREREQRVELAARERELLGGALHLDEAALAGHDDVHVHVGAAVLLVGEVEHRHGVDDARPRRPPPGR